MQDGSPLISRPKWKKASLFGFAGLSVLALFALSFSWRSHIKVRHLDRKIKNYIKRSTRENTSLPNELIGVPFAEESGLVLSVKTVEIPEVLAPYNGSIIEHGDGYLLFFRYDTLDSRLRRPRYTHVGCVELDREFELGDHLARQVDTQNLHSEDPRAVRLGDQIYLCYNEPRGAGRVMRLGRFDLERAAVVDPITLDPDFCPIEKNWPPFEGILEDGTPSIQLEYSLNPRILLQVDDLTTGALSAPSHPKSQLMQHLNWSPSWGRPLRGGAPPRRVEDQFLGFFHSSFRDKKGMFWYVMGAYTFEAKPPFRITAISSHPILFEGIYESLILNTAGSGKRVIFPAGFVTEEKNGKQLIHLACGENDASIKIVTLDQEVLLRSLKSVQ